MKKIVLIVSMALLLSACNDKVSGAFSGAWVYEKNPTHGATTIIDKGDHYSVHVVDTQMAIDKEFDAIEKDGKYLENEKTGQRYYTLIDSDHIKVGTNGGVYVKAK
ncbi:membrane lipoprotein lipid attachment site-containing protein [Salmonella enterica]|nr:membrane lipoprotein lipid attachment site-containing protein [Salmonella enterica]